MFNWFKKNRKVDLYSLSSRKLRLTYFSVNLVILTGYIKGYNSRRGVLYRDPNGRYSLICEERSSFRTRLLFTPEWFDHGSPPALVVEVDEDKEGKLELTVTYKFYTIVFADLKIKSEKLSLSIDNVNDLEEEFSKLCTLGMFEVYDLFCDFSVRLRKFLQISDEEYKAMLESKAKELWSS